MNNLGLTTTKLLVGGALAIYIAIIVMFPVQITDYIKEFLLMCCGVD